MLHLLTPKLLSILWLAAVGQASPFEQPTPAAQSGLAAPSPLIVAIAAGEAQIVATALGGTSGDTLRLEVVNQTAQERTWRLLPGAVALSGNPAVPDFAIRRIRGRSVDPQRYEPTDVIQLKPGETGVYVCEAYSMNFQRENPSSAARYTLSAPRPPLQKLFQAAERANPSTRAMQAAVWGLLTQIKKDDLMRRFPVSDEEYALAEGLIRMSEGQPQPALTPLFGSSAPAPTFAAPRLATVADLPSPSGEPASEPASGPTLQLKAGFVSFAQRDGQPVASAPILFQWTVPTSARPQTYVGALRFEGEDVVTSVSPGDIRFDEDAGRFDALVPRGDLRGQGDLVYAVIGGVSPQTDPAKLDELFDTPEELRRQSVSNILRIPVNWDALGAASRPAAAGAPASSSAAPASRPAATPAATGRRRPRPSSAPTSVEVSLPLKNGGMLHGVLIGVENGQLVLEYKSRRFTCDPRKLSETPEQLLAEALKAHADGRDSTALQYAFAASLLLKDPTEAKALVGECRKSLGVE
ncbi:MAG: hypothetical protein NTW86_31345 [Candidatus Sumerlaeota bacterium]|nr:hypothetical protein [Candidatus Sumerlaeota bacterium]